MNRRLNQRKKIGQKKKMIDKYIVTIDRGWDEGPSSIMGYSNLKQAKEDYAFQKNCAYDHEIVYLAKIINSTKGD